MRAVSAHLDALDHATRLAEVRACGRRHQARLFDAAQGHLPIDLAWFVPRDEPPLAEVVHHGKNSLPLFTHFAKPMCRPDGDREGHDELWGYNRNSWLIETFVGPGFFVVTKAETPGEVWIDYTQSPPRRPEGWPKIIPNSHRISFFVYNGTKDLMRGVSSHVSIGRATRKGKPMNAWFLLCRED